MLAASVMEGSRTTLDETVMPPPSTPRGVKRKAVDKEASLPVSGFHWNIIVILKMNIWFIKYKMWKNKINSSSPWNQLI